MNEIRNRELSLTEQSTWLLFAKVVSFGLSTLLPLLTVRYLVQEQVGVYRQAFLVITNAAVVLPLGFSMSAYYYLNRASNKHASVVFNILLFNFLVGGGAFLTLFFAPELLGRLFRNDELTVLAPLIGVAIWLWIFSGFLEIAALANREARRAIVFIILAQFTKTVFMVGAVVAFATVKAFIYAGITQAALQTISLIIYLNRRFPRFWTSFDWRCFVEQMRYAMPFGFASLLYIGQTDIHNYFVSYRFGPSEFAIYSQGGFQLPLIAILYESISSVVIPRMSRLQEEGQKREMLLITVRATEKLAFVYLPLFFFLMVVAKEFITTLFTNDYAASVPIFRINLLMLPFFCLMVDPVGRAFAEVGRFLLKVRLVLFIGLIFALWYGINNFYLPGMITIVVVFVIAEKVISGAKALLMLEVSRKDIGLLSRIGRTAAAAAIAGVALLGFYIISETFLMQTFTQFWHDALSNSSLKWGTEFIAGSTFLGICFSFYVLVYLLAVSKLKVLGHHDTERLSSLFREAGQRLRAKIGRSYSLADKT